MSNAISEEDLRDLTRLIEDWLGSFKKVFPEFELKPEMHYLIHYPSQVRKHGPPSKFATIRFEAKHQELKNFIRASRNRKNVCLTMAKRHQLKMCVSAATYEKETAIEKYVACDVSLPQETDFWPGTKATKPARRVVYQGQEYSAGDVVVVKTGNGTASLRKIEYVLLDFAADQCRLVCSSFASSQYDSSLLAFRVEQGRRLESVRLEDLADHHPLGIYHVHNSFFVVLKYNISKYAII